MIVDDLAGACDTGIEFLDSVGCVTVIVDSDIPEIEKDQFEGLVVWNTESRGLSVKEAYSSEWKERVRTRIRRSDGVIALVSKNSLTSSGQKWEIACASEEKKRLLGIWAYKDDRTNLEGVRTVVWTWDAIKNFIDSL